VILAASGRRKASRRSPHTKAPAAIVAAGVVFFQACPR
jgi:hypothetical protein